MTLRSRSCRHPGCPKVTKHPSGFCIEKHYKPRQKDYDKQRGTSVERGYDALWRKVRRMQLKAHPMCQCDDCKERGKVANMVHHIKDVETYPDLRLDLENLLSMDNDCHERLEARLGHRWTSGDDPLAYQRTMQQLEDVRKDRLDKGKGAIENRYNRLIPYTERAALRAREFKIEKNTADKIKATILTNIGKHRQASANNSNKEIVCAK